jgi:hypothetical protein
LWNPVAARVPAKSLHPRNAAKYARINQDDLATVIGARNLLSRKLSNGESVLSLITCNFDKEQREKFVAIASSTTPSMSQ